MSLIFTASFTEEEMSRLSHVEILNQSELTDKVEYDLSVAIYELGTIEEPKNPTSTSFLEKLVEALRKCTGKNTPSTQFHPKKILPPVYGFNESGGDVPVFIREDYSVTGTDGAGINYVDKNTFGESRLAKDIAWTKAVNAVIANENPGDLANIHNDSSFVHSQGYRRLAQPKLLGYDVGEYNAVVAEFSFKVKVVFEPQGEPVPK